MIRTPLAISTIGPCRFSGRLSPSIQHKRRRETIALDRNKQYEDVVVIVSGQQKMLLLLFFSWFSH